MSGSTCGSCERPGPVDETWGLCAACHADFLIDVDVECSWEELPPQWKERLDPELGDEARRRAMLERIRAFELVQSFRYEISLSR